MIFEVAYWSGRESRSQVALGQCAWSLMLLYKQSVVPWVLLCGCGSRVGANWKLEAVLDLLFAIVPVIIRGLLLDTMKAFKTGPAILELLLLLDLHCVSIRSDYLL